jgi:S1-C subfamily serine protease
MLRSKKSKNLSMISLVTTVLLLSSFACNFGSDSTDEPPPPPPTSSSVVQNTPTSRPTVESQPTEETGPLPVGVEISDLARATVQIFALVASGADWDIVWTGSGSIISPDGFILTNAHVVDDRDDEYTSLGIAMTDRTDQPPDLVYLAEIVNVDYRLDLSVIKISSDLGGALVSPNLPFISLGDSDGIDIGEKMRILGFPGIGGETITFTEGAVSGFTQERGIEGRAWIKTDATIAGGNSGGMAANIAGELIGVPTRAAADQIVDCRAVADTNRDGSVDNNDTCVPIGGFLNGLRPINLAKPLIEAAFNNQEYASGGDPAVQGGEFDLTDVDFYNLIFAESVVDDMPTDQWYALPAGSTGICAFWDFAGMEDGMVWSALWFTNGELDESRSFLENTWQGGYEGNWWVCMSSETGLADGTYELILEVQGETMVSEAIFVGGNRSVVDFVIVNESSIEICYVQISATTASGWGQDELGSTETIASGFERPFTLATGYYDLRMLDCDAEVIYEEYEFEVLDYFTFTLTD